MRWRLLLLICLAPLMALASPELDRLLEEGEAQPQQALQRLRDLPAATAAPTAAQRRHAEAKLLLMTGELDAALRVHAGDAAGSAGDLYTRSRVARLRGQLGEAVELIERSLALQRADCEPQPKPACDTSLLFDSLLLRARLHDALDERLQAEQVLQRALLLARASGVAGRVAVVLADLAQQAQLQDQGERARQLLDEARREAAGLPLRLAQVRLAEAVVARRTGQHAQRRQALEAALVLASDAPRLAAIALNNLSDHFLLAGEPAQARRLAEQALADPRRQLDPVLEQSLRHNLAVSLIRLREFDAAREQVRRAERLLPPGALTDRERAEELRDLGRAWAAAGQWRDALRFFHDERELTERADARERDNALAALKQSLEARTQEANLALERERAAVLERTLRNQQVLQWLGWLGGALVGICLLIGLLLWVGSRAAHQRLQRSREQLQTLSERDPLTQLGNRRAFQQLMQSLGDRPFEGGLLIVDLDHFKRINDGQGHAVGDQVLQAVARRLAAQVRKDDLLVRWGGEEFLVYAPGVSPLGIRQLATRLLRAVELEPLALDGGKPLAVSASLGFAVFPLPPHQRAFDWERAVNWVDLALYAAKNAGRARGVGILGAQLVDDTALAQIEADFEGAALAARIELVQVVAGSP